MQQSNFLSVLLFWSTVNQLYLAAIKFGALAKVDLFGAP